MKDTPIQWTDHSLNFWWGCFKVSPGCEHCYAETLSKRAGREIWGPAKATERWRTTGPWRDVRSWERRAGRLEERQRVFCQSMSDFFEEHPQLDAWRAEACYILDSLQWLDVQLLTKRPENIARMVPASWMEKWPEHVWIGTSVEDQKRADERIPHLLEIPAAVRFLSCEPLLGPIDLSAYLTPHWTTEEKPSPKHGIGFPPTQRVARLRPRVNWVIAGGESGAGARPMHIDWARSIRDQCQVAGVPFFMKQMGGTRDKGGDLNSMPDDLRIREFPR